MLINNDTNRFLQHLGRGGYYQYLWRDEKTPPKWFKVGQRVDLPNWDAVYFCVNPQMVQLEGLKRGGVSNVMAINTLYSEHDIKDGWTIEQIHQLQPEPSIIIASGGGWHLYWWLDEPELITPENLQELKEIQARWNAFTGGDTAAKDLARVLRLPGSRNNKYQPARKVEFLTKNFDKLYTIKDLLEYLPEPVAKLSTIMENYQTPSINAGSFWLQRALARLGTYPRNDTGLWLACQLRDAGLTESEAIPYMEEYALQVPEVPDNPYSENDAIASLKQAMGAPRRLPAQNQTPILKLDNTKPMKIEPVAIIEEPEPEPEEPTMEEITGDDNFEIEINDKLAPPLPPGVMPDWVLMKGAGRFIDLYTDYARKISPMTPDTFHQSAALVMAATVIARRIKINMPYDVIYPNLYIVWVAQTTLFRKTTAMNIAKRILYKHFWELLAPQDFTVEALLSDLAGMMPSNFEKMPQTEKDRWMLSRDFSAQKTCLLDEFSGLFASAGKDYGGGLLESFLRFYDCEPDYKRTTRGQGLVVIRNAYMSLLGATTPAAISTHTTNKNVWGNGFWSRFILLTPEGMPEYYIDPEEEPEPAAIGQSLLNLHKRLERSKYPEPHPEISAGIDAEAFKVWDKYNKALSFNLLVENTSVNPILFGSYGRLPTHALKAALIMAAMEWPELQPAPRVELKHMVRGILMAEEWRESLHRVIEKVEASEYDNFAQRIMKVIGKYLNKGASLRDLHRDMRDKNPIEIQNQLMQMAMEHTIEMKIYKPEKGGRPSERYFIVSE